MKNISHVQHIIFISAESPFHTLGFGYNEYFNIHNYKHFLGLQRSIGQQKQVQFQKIIKKTTGS